MVLDYFVSAHTSSWSVFDFFIEGTSASLLNILFPGKRPWPISILPISALWMVLVLIVLSSPYMLRTTTYLSLILISCLKVTLALQLPTCHGQLFILILFLLFSSHSILSFSQSIIHLITHVSNLESIYTSFSLIPHIWRVNKCSWIYLLNTFQIYPSSLYFCYPSSDPYQLFLSLLKQAPFWTPSFHIIPLKFTLQMKTERSI